MQWGALSSTGLLFGALLLSGGIAHAQPSPPAEKAPSKQPPAAEAPVEGKAPGADKPVEGGAPRAADPNCPPNAYCQTEEVGPPADVLASPDGGPVEGTAEGTAEGGGESVVVVQRTDGSATVELPPPPAGSDPQRPRTFTYVPPTKRRPGQIIIYDDGALPPHLLPGDGLDEPPPNRFDLRRPPRRSRLHPRRWGINLRANAAILPRYRNSNSNYGMFGVGMSLRYRPAPAFAFDVGADFLGGRDSAGLERQEMPFSASAVLYPNPNSFAQLYFYGGMNWAFARVFADQVQPNLAEGDRDNYTYIGGHVGGGMEFRFTPLFGLSLDAQMYLRTRTDDDGDGRFAEFVDQNSGDFSNTTVGGLARAGVNFWW